jgi:hypothetical protein
MATTAYELVEPKLDTSLIVPEEFDQFRHMVQHIARAKLSQICSAVIVCRMAFMAFAMRWMFT